MSSDGRDPFYDGLTEDALLAATGKEFAAPGQSIDPVQIEWTRVCEFRMKPCGLCGKSKGSKVHTPKRTATCAFRRQLGCATCGKAKAHPDHLGAPESFNLFASGSWEAYQSAKKRWHAVLGPLLEESPLPRGLDHVLVEGEVSFGDARERDQGNSRVVIEKAFGDVLVEEGYLKKDTWPHYEFGGLQLAEAGVNRIRLMIFPRAPAVPEEPAQGALL